MFKKKTRNQELEDRVIILERSAKMEMYKQLSLQKQIDDTNDFLMKRLRELEETMYELNK